MIAYDLSIEQQRALLRTAPRLGAMLYDPDFDLEVRRFLHEFAELAIEDADTSEIENEAFDRGAQEGRDEGYQARCDEEGEELVTLRDANEELRKERDALEAEILELKKSRRRKRS